MHLQLLDARTPMDVRKLECIDWDKFQGSAEYLYTQKVLYMICQKFLFDRCQACQNLRRTMRQCNSRICC
jgi:hypothetical protein